MKRTKIPAGKRFPVALAVVLLCSLVAYAVPCIGATVTGPPATVAEVEGTALLHPDGESESKAVSRGNVLNPWDTVSTKDKTKLFLTWNNGLKASMGEFSALLYSPDEDANGPIDEIQVIEGIARMATGEERRQQPPRFFVSTPLAYVEPADLNEPVDFIVEVYDPSKTVVTVVSGRVRIKGPEGREWTEKTVFGCKTVFIEEGKDKIVVLSAGTDDLERLIAATTITGTLHANMEACRPSTAREPVGPEPPIAYRYPDYPEYYEEIWDVVEYPYWEIRVIRVHGGYCEIWIPGAGHFWVPIPVGGGWVFDPTVVEVYARYAFCHRALLYDKYHWKDLRMRRRELHNMIVLAKQAGNMNLLMKLNRELDDVNVRAEWAGRRINRLERRVGELQDKRQRFAGQLPKDFNLYQKVSDSFDSQRNLKVMQQFQDQIQNRTVLQNRLAGMAGQDIASLRDRIARERDPAKRMALRSELGKIKKEVAEGKLPLSKDRTELRNLLTQAGKAGEGEKQTQARQELLSRLEKQKGVPLTDLVNQKTLAEVKQAVDKKANPQTRQRLDRRIGQIQQSVESRREDEAQLKKIERMTAEAVKENDPEKRREILGTLKELSKSPSGPGVPSTMNFMQQQRNLEQQLGEVKDKQKRDAIQRSIEDLKRKQQEQTLQQQLEEQRRVRQQVIGDGDRAKQDELKRLKEGQDRKVGEQQLKDQQEKARQAEQLRLQQEKTRQTEMLHKQQEEQKRLMDQKARDQQEKSRQAEQLRLQQEKARQTEMLHKQKEEQKRLMDQKARDQQEKARQAEQLRLQQEKTRQTEMLHKQQEQQKRLMEQKAREQQEKARQADQLRQQQMRLQQEKARQSDQLRRQQMQQQQMRLQQEKSRQAEQVRRQQVQQQQMQLQQQRAQQAQQARQQQILKHQEELKKKLEQKPR